MNLYLVRHGIAQNTGIDSQRELTDEGKERLLQDFSQLVDEFRGQKIAIMSSPYTRAFQTAQIFTDVMGDAGVLDNCIVEAASNDCIITQKQYIVDGDYDKLLDDIVYYEDLGVTSLVVFGHEPTMSIWHANLTGQFLSFSRGMVAKIELN